MTTCNRSYSAMKKIASLVDVGAFGPGVQLIIWKEMNLAVADSLRELATRLNLQAADAEEEIPAKIQ